MEIAVVSTPRLSATLTVDDVQEAQKKVFTAGLKAYSDEASPEKGAVIKWEYGPRAGETFAYAFVILRHDQRAKVTFSKPNNAHGDAIVHMQDFNKDVAFAAALRIILGDGDFRFRSKERVATLVKKFGVAEIVKALPPVFSDFMWAVAHAVNCKLGKDVGEKVRAFRQQVQAVVPHLSLSDVVTIYKEEMVEWVSKK